MQYYSNAESDHPYANNYSNVWTITNPNPEAVSSKVHFSRIELARGDRLQVLDANDTVIQTFSRGNTGGTSVWTDLWSDYVPGRIVKFRLSTSGTDTAWGFRVNEIHPSSTQPSTPAAVTGVYVTIANPGTIYLNNARLLDASTAGEYKILLPNHGDHLIRIEYAEHTQIIQVRVDEKGAISINYLPLQGPSRVVATTTPALVSGLYMTLAHRGTIYLNESVVTQATASGEYKIPISGRESGTIRIEYLEETQQIDIALDEEDDSYDIYLPAVIAAGR
jgi:hypothetical protein